MAQYIDQPYVEGMLGAGLLADVLSVEGVNLTQMIEAASAGIASRLRGAGYTPPSTLVGATNDCVPLLKLGTYALVREMIAEVPDAAQPLPDNWRDGLPKKTLDDIESGKADLDLPLSPADAVGGVLFSEADPSLANGQPQFTSRNNLGGY